MCTRSRCRRRSWDLAHTATVVASEKWPSETWLNTTQTDGIDESTVGFGRLFSRPETLDQLARYREGMRRART
jgi:hypothetical protein